MNYWLLVTHPGNFEIMKINKQLTINVFRKWPAKYWKLGFQGNVHEIPKEDYEIIKKGFS